MNTAHETKADIYTRTDDYHEFWNNIDRVTGFVVPAYIRNVLKFHGFDSTVSVKLIDDDDIKVIETFVTSGGMLRTLKSDVDLEDFYGPFVESRSDFQILPGHRKVLMGISAFLREKGLQFFDDDSKPIKNNGARRVKIESVTFADCNNSNTQNNTKNFTTSTGASSPMTPTTTTTITTPSSTSRLATNTMGSTPKNAISSDVKVCNRHLQKITVRRNDVLMHRLPYQKIRPLKERQCLDYMDWILHSFHPIIGCQRDNNKL